MPTVTKSFSWASDLQGWTGDGMGTNVAWDGQNGTPPGCISISPPGGSTANVGLFSAVYSGTWESLGVPPSSIITAIRLDSSYSMANIGQVQLGPYTLNQNGNKLATLCDYRTSVGAEDKWIGITQQPNYTVPSGANASNSVIQLLISNNFRSQSTAVNRYDETSYVITYNPASSNTVQNESGSLSTTVNQFILSGSGSFSNGNVNNPSNPGTANPYSFNGSSSLVIFGKTGEMNLAAPMYISSSNNINKPKGFNLFIKQQTPTYPRQSSSSLYIKGSQWPELFPNPLPLFVNGYVDSIHHGMNLIISNKNVINNVSLLIKGSNSSIYSRNGLSPLFVSGYGKLFYTTPTLFISQTIQGSNNNNNPMKLFISGPKLYNSINPKVTPSLFINGLSNYSIGNSTKATSPLYIFAGNYQCKSVNLFIKAGNIPNITGGTALNIVGSRGNGSYAIVPLFINGSIMSESMNLVIKGKDSGGNAKIIRLFIDGENPNVNLAAPLFINNGYLAFQGPSTELFIKGEGQNFGYFPSSESLGLYIERGNSGGTTLYIENKMLGGTVPLQITGLPSFKQSSPLFIAGYGGTTEKSIPLNILGDVFKEHDASSTLVIPNVVGFTPNVAYLYTNGFEY